MALIKCPDCNKDVSNQAVSCLNCGRPIIGTLNQTPHDVAVEIYQTYSQIIKNIGGDINSAKKSEVKEYKETIRNLILTNAAVAAFSLPLLSSPEILRVPLIFGIVLLLINIVIAYAHLQRGWTNAFKTFVKNEKVLLTPAIEITNFAVKVMRGTENINDLIDKDKKFKEAGGQYDRLSQYLSNASAENQKLNHADDGIMILFILALACLIYSIIGIPLAGFLAKLFPHINLL